MRAPPAKASTFAAVVPSMRSPSSFAPLSSPTNRLRDTPIATGSPSSANLGSSRSTASECCVRFAKPTPGSIAIRSRATPASRAHSTRVPSSAMISPTTSSPYPASAYVPIVATSPRECMRITPAFWSAHTSAIFASRRKPDTSLMTSAPCARTARATPLFTVSIEIGTWGCESCSRWSTGSTRASSSSSLTGVAPCGRVDSPPMSSMSAPIAISRRPCAAAAEGEKNLPPSLKLSGVTLMIPMIRGRFSCSVRDASRHSAALTRVSAVRRRSRRRDLRSTEQPRPRGLRLRDHTRRHRRWNRRGRSRLSRRKRDPLHEHRRIIGGERLALQQRLGHPLEQIAVVDQRLLRARIRVVEQPRDLRVHQLRRTLRHLAVPRELAAEEDFLLVVANEHGADRVGQSPLRHVAPREPRRLLDVARGASGHLIATEHQLLRHATAVRHDQPRLELLARDRVAILDGEREGYSQRAAPRHDRHLVQRIAAGRLDRAHRVAGLVVRRIPLLVVLHHHRLALGAKHDLVLGLLEIVEIHLVGAAARGEQRGLVHEIREIGAGHSRSAARDHRHFHIVGDGHLAQMHA